MKSKKSNKRSTYTTRILKFGEQGEKTGWTYIEIPADVASKINPGVKKSFRVKGTLDNHKISGIALLPMGKGNFIMPLNVSMRKAIGKRHGAMLKVSLEIDLKKAQISKDLMTCLKDEPDALAYFSSLAPSHQNYFSKWIESTKSPETKAVRIARTIKAMLRKLNYGEMLREKI